MTVSRSATSASCSRRAAAQALAEFTGVVETGVVREHLVPLFTGLAGDAQVVTWGPALDVQPLSHKLWEGRPQIYAATYCCERRARSPSPYPGLTLPLPWHAQLLALPAVSICCV